MSYRLQYVEGSKYAHLNSAAFPSRYPDAVTAAQARARVIASCGDRGDIEITETED